MAGQRGSRRLGLLVGGVLIFVGIVIVMVSVGLYEADKLANVLGFFIALIGLGLEVYWMFLAPRPPSPPPTGKLGRAVGVVGAVTGLIGVGLQAYSVLQARRPASPPSTTGTPLPNQLVTNRVGDQEEHCSEEAVHQAARAEKAVDEAAHGAV